MRAYVSVGLGAFLALFSAVLWLSPSELASAQQTENHYVYIEPIPDWATDYASNSIYYSTLAWEEANPHIKFYTASSPEEADLIVQWIRDYGSDYLGETIGGTVIQVGLGNSLCMNEWHPFSSDTVTLIAEHEIGHYLGLDHSSDPNSIMYPTLNFRYGMVEVEESLAPNYSWFVPVCTPEGVTSYNYQVETDDPTYGFDVYFVPSQEEYDKHIAGETFSYYSAKECFGENYLQYSGTCEGVPQKSGLLIVAGEKLTNPLQRITVRLLEVPYSSSASTVLPKIEQQAQSPLSTSSADESPFTVSSSSDSKYVDVFGTGFSVLTTTQGGIADDIFVNESSKTLIIYLRTTGDGELTIRQPRDLIDAKKENGADTFFVVFADGEETYYEEDSKDDTYRTITIHFPKGTEKIEVMGTRVIPEFDALAYLILSLGIASAIVISSRLRLNQRYF